MFTYDKEIGSESKNGTGLGNVKSFGSSDF